MTPCLNYTCLIHPMTFIPATWPGNQPRAKRCKRESVSSNQSAILDKLLELVGKGDTHLQTAADFARAVVEDCPNAAHPGIHHIAACGANGKFDGNTERDFQRLVRGFNGLSLEPYTIKLRLQVLRCYFSNFWFYGGLNFAQKCFLSTPAPSSNFRDSQYCQAQVEKDENPQTVAASVLLPHEVFGALYRMGEPKARIVSKQFKPP